MIQSASTTFCTQGRSQQASNPTLSLVEFTSTENNLPPSYCNQVISSKYKQ